MRIFLILISFLKKLWFSSFFFSKEEKSKTVMLEQKQGQFCSLHWIQNKVLKRYFQFSFFIFSVFRKKLLFSCVIRKIRRELKISLQSFVRNSMQIPKLSLFFTSIDSFWLLLFWRFKNTLYGRGKYIYRYIYICIYIYSIIMEFWSN